MAGPEAKIPLHRSGLVLFASEILSILTGMVFLVMITGWLPPARFGLWEVLLSFVAFAQYPAGWLSFWATRQVARGGLVARTAILLNLVLSLGGLVIFFAIAAFTSSLSGPNAWSFVYVAAIVPIAYWNQASIAVAAGMKPVAIGYSIFVSELAKLAVAYPALFIFKMGLNGAIIAVFTSYAVQASLTTFLVSGAAKSNVDFGLARRWIADAWIPAAYSLGGTIASADTVVAWLASGAFVVTGYYQAAFQIGILVSYANYLSYALYPILLRGESDKAVNAALDFILMFGIPMTFGVVALAPHLLNILSTAYTLTGFNVSPALMILSVCGLFVAVSVFLDSVLIGTEKADLAQERSFRAYRKSNFIFVSLTNLGYTSVYVVGVFLVVKLGLAAGWSLPAIVETWAMVQALTLSAAIVVKYKRARLQMSVGMPRTVGLYLVASVIMAALLSLLSPYLLLPGPSRLVYGIRVMGMIGFGALLYFGTLAALSGRVRGLAKTFLNLLYMGRSTRSHAQEAESDGS